MNKEMKQYTGTKTVKAMGSVDRGVVIRSSSRFDKMFNVFTFADGAPFGAKEE